MGELRYVPLSKTRYPLSSTHDQVFCIMICTWIVHCMIQPNPG